MKLRGTELVLVFDWLANLGNFRANFGNLFLMYLIEGDPSLSIGHASWKSVMNDLPDQELGFYVL